MHPTMLIAWLCLGAVLVIALLSRVGVARGLDPAKRGFMDVAWAGRIRT